MSIKRGRPIGACAKPLPDPGELLHLLENCNQRQVCKHYGVTQPTLRRWLMKFKMTAPTDKWRFRRSITAAAPEQRANEEKGNG